MKNESDQQLREQWEAAELKDFELHIDTENLWQKIQKPEKKRTVTFTWLRYAAAMLLGALITFGLTQLSKQEEVLVQEAAQPRSEDKPGLAAIPATPQKSLPQRNDADPAVPLKQRISVPKVPGGNSLAGSRKEEPRMETPEKKQTTTLPAQQEIMHIPFVPEDTRMASISPKAKPKTIHLLDLEKREPPVQKQSKFMMALDEHINPKLNDMAFSTKVLTKQF